MMDCRVGNYVAPRNDKNKKSVFVCAHLCLNTVMKWLLQFLIKIYALILSPWMGNQCRFAPTCSAYASQAIDKHGVIKGGWLAIKRIVKCHPYYKGNGIDPVP